MLHPDSQYIWIEGKLLPYNEANVHLLSHSLHYGTGVFEGIRAYQTSDGKTAIFRAEEHYRRFLDSVKIFGSISFSMTQLVSSTCEVISANRFKECYIRPLAFLDDSYRGLKLPQAKLLTAIATWDWGKYLGDKAQKEGIRVKISSFRRADPSSSFPWAKITGQYLIGVLARKEAVDSGVEEALLLDGQGFIAEGSGENVFMVKDRILYTPPVGAILPGITRDSVIQLAKSIGFSVVERPITRSEIYLADELFFTGTAVELTPICELDGRKVKDGHPGPITQKLQHLFFDCVRGKISEFKNWLNPVS